MINSDSQLDLFSAPKEILHADCRWPTGYHCHNDVCESPQSTQCYYRSPEWQQEVERLNEIEKQAKEKYNARKQYL